MGPRRGGASIVMAAVRAIGLHLPCKGLVAARASARTEFYFTCIAPRPAGGRPLCQQSLLPLEARGQSHASLYA